MCKTVTDSALHSTLVGTCSVEQGPRQTEPIAHSAAWRSLVVVFLAQLAAPAAVGSVVPHHVVVVAVGHWRG